MAIRKDIEYPGRWLAATAAYPMGEAKNRTTSTSKDGSYLEKKWIQDYEAFFGALLNEAGVSPDGSVDTAESSQFFDALTYKVNGVSGSNYVKLPSGLILQWILVQGSTTGNTYSMPIEFPNNVYTVSGATNIGALKFGVRILSNSSFTLTTENNTQDVHLLFIGD
ncbi:tail fiber protein [Vibrio phage F35 g1]|nr:putative tail fiber protein [Vibrio phage 115E34-1]CAH9016103.1 putative tail fiber protein [Vibrio phage 511E55-1]CAH9016670.1 putative tail fiber protein [Vibrio phage 120E34-1]